MHREPVYRREPEGKGEYCMARNKNVRMKAPDDSHAVSIEGVEYEGKRGYFEVSPAHAEVLEARPFLFKRVAVDAEDRADDAADAVDFDKMSKAELIDFCVERGETADRKMSKEQLVDMAKSVADKPAQEA